MAARRRAAPSHAEVRRQRTATVRSAWRHTYMSAQRRRKSAKQRKTFEQLIAQHTRTVLLTQCTPAWASLGKSGLTDSHTKQVGQSPLSLRQTPSCDSNRRPFFTIFHFVNCSNVNLLLHYVDHLHLDPICNVKHTLLINCIMSPRPGVSALNSSLVL